MQAQVDRRVEVRATVCELFDEDVDFAAWAASLLVEIIHQRFLPLGRAETYVPSVLTVKARFASAWDLVLGERAVKVVAEILDVLDPHGESD